MTEWKEYKLGEIVQSISDTYKFVDNEKVVFLNTSDILNGKFLNDCLVSAATLPGQAKKKIQKGDILFSEIRPANKRFAIVDFESSNYVVSTKLMVLRCNEQIYNKFLYIYLTSYEVLEYLQMIAEDRSGTFPQITFDNIANMSISLPPLPEQIRIASILSSLDDKIDLLHRENKTLEAMAETLFRQCFIEEAKEDWEEGKLGDEFEFIMGQSPSGESFNEDGIGFPMYQGNADFGFRFPTRRVFTTQPTRFAEINDTLISVRAPVGAQNMATEKCCIGRGVAAFRYKDNSSFYSYTYYKLKSLLDDIKQYNDNGTVFGSISKSDFENIDIMIPDKDTILNFQKQVKPIDDKIINNNYEIQTLIQQRDGLLPKLMSGEVKI